MTQRHSDPDSISNYFDSLLQGIGRRGSSFTDVDALTHDDDTDRFLFQEFKKPDEAISYGQAKALKGLARRDFITVWCVRLCRDGRLDWFDVGTREQKTITVSEYQMKFRSWWGVTVVTTPAVMAPKAVLDIEPPALPKPVARREDVPLMTADEIDWYGRRTD